MNVKTTKKTRASKTDADDMRPEYRFDYSKAHPNRFAGRSAEKRLVVVLEPEIASVFPTPEAVNNALRSLIMAISQARLQKA